MPNTIKPTKIDIKAKFSKKNIGFSLTDENRPSFKHETDYNAWLTKTFTHDYEPSSYNRHDTLNATIHKKVSTTIEDELKVKYVLVEVDGKKLLYFVLKARIKNNITIEYTLRLDVWTTYYLDIKINGNVRLGQAHGVRFTSSFEVGGVKWRPDLRINSDLFSTEQFDKPLLVRTDISSYSIKQAYTDRLNAYNNKFAFTTGTDKFYIFAVIKPSHDEGYSVDSGYPQPYFIAPVSPHNTDTSEPNLYEKLVASPLTQGLFISYTPYGVDHEMQYKLTSYGGFNIFDPLFTTPIANPILLESDDKVKLPHEKSYHFGDGSIQPDDIIEDPKITTEFSKYDITFYDGQRFEIDQKKVLDSKFIAMYRNIDPINNLTVLEFNDNSYYPNNKFHDIGIVKHNDSDQLPSITDQYNEYMRSHRNQIEQERAAAKASMVKGGLSSFIGLASSYGMGVVGAGTGNPVLMMGAVSGMANSVNSAIGTGINAGLDMKTINRRLDDISHTADTIKNVSISTPGHVWSLHKIYKGLGFKLIKTYPSAISLKEINEHFIRNGYFLDKYRHVISDNIRHSLYVRARFDFITITNIDQVMDRSPFPSEVYEEIRSIFSSGVRVWHDKENIQNYEIENWERDIFKAYPYTHRNKRMVIEHELTKQAVKEEK